MTKTALLSAAALGLLLVAVPSGARQFEAVHGINYVSNESAKAALDALMQDPAVKGSKVTLYAREFGSSEATHLVVQDFDGYAEYMDATARRIASPGWAKYLEQTRDSKYLGSQVAIVLDDHGASRRSAGYIAAYLIKTTEPATYRAAVAELGKAIGNPGVLRLVALRTGDMGATHAVLIGGADFKAVNEYIDKMIASDAFATFTAKVGGIRNVVGLDMYRRVANWGD